MFKEKKKRLKDKLKVKILFKPFKTRGEKRAIGYYDDKSRTEKIIEIDTRESISNMVEIMYHEFTHLVVTYFALDPQCVKEIKKTIEKGQYKFKAVDEDKEHIICDLIGEYAKKVFEKKLKE